LFVHQGDAIAGSASIIDFTLSNQGQAPANNLSCLITVEDGGGGGGGGDGDEQHNQATFLEVPANCVNESSTQVRCGIEELKAAGINPRQRPRSRNRMR